MFIVIYHCCISLMHAALAQSVERRLGKAEVGGSIPLGSLQRKPRKPVKNRGFTGFFAMSGVIWKCLIILLLYLLLPLNHSCVVVTIVVTIVVTFFY